MHMNNTDPGGVLGFRIRHCGELTERTSMQSIVGAQSHRIGKQKKYNRRSNTKVYSLVLYVGATVTALYGSGK